MSFERELIIPKPEPEFYKPVCEKIEKTKEETNKYTMFCRHFIRGKCTRGDKCNFAHGMDQWNPNCCMFKEKCNKGDSCRWFHPDLKQKKSLQEDKK